MNILYITNHLNIGGITSYVLSLASGLKKRGHNVYLASGGGQLLPRFTEAGIIYIPVPLKTKQELSPKIIISKVKLSGAIKRYDIDIVHSNSRTTQVLGCLLSRAAGIPHISTCHGFFKKRFFRRVFPCWGKKVIAISAQVKEHLIRDFGVAEKDIFVIHNGIDADKFRPRDERSRSEFRKRLGLSAGPVIGIVARLSDVKGHVYLIEAMREVLDANKEAQLLIVGEGRMKEKLVKLAGELKIVNSIFFIPEVEDTRGVLSTMDLFVMPSLKEGLGLALMEAMAAGLAVVASNIGGIKSLIKDDESGLLVEPADVRGLSAAITELLRNPAKAESLGSKARAFISENFSEEKMVSETEEVYSECLNAED
jgi:glycosyltransferase involved in cell wall biosynthesis